MKFATVAAAIAACLCPVSTGLAQVERDDALVGSWATERYLLAGGPEHELRGHIFFTDREWSVLFFVMDGTTPARGSGEGGTYTLHGDQLVFTHLYHLSAGKAVDGLPEAPLRMTAVDRATGPGEHCRISLEGDRLTIFFPSGNAMTFRRQTG